MAYDVKTISPLDVRKSISIGVKIPFSEGVGFTRVYTTKEQLKYNIINYLLTDKRERIFSPNFGSGIRRRLFEQITQETTDQLEYSLTTQIENYFPNIKVTRLSVTSNPNKNTINILFSYYVINTNENDTILIDLQK